MSLLTILTISLVVLVIASIVVTIYKDKHLQDYQEAKDYLEKNYKKVHGEIRDEVEILMAKTNKVAGRLRTAQVILLGLSIMCIWLVMGIGGFLN